MVIVAQDPINQNKLKQRLVLRGVAFYIQLIIILFSGLLNELISLHKVPIL
jgi:hypothetical protein